MAAFFLELREAFQKKIFKKINLLQKEGGVAWSQSLHGFNWIFMDWKMPNNIDWLSLDKKLNTKY